MNFFKVADILSISRDDLIHLLMPLFKIYYYGQKHYCPICNSHVRKFLPVIGDDYIRLNAKCPVCRKVERTRFAWLVILRKMDTKDFKGKKFLHFAPELVLDRKLKNIPNIGYISADLENPNVMIMVDILDIPFSNESVDTLFCSHVLEHVSDDIRAMKEMNRIIKKKGIAIIQVPISAEKTFEDPTAVTPSDRKRLFGQSDHVRRYGHDVFDRLEGSGFRVTHVTSDDILSPEERFCMGIPDNESLFLCEK